MATLCRRSHFDNQPGLLIVKHISRSSDCTEFIFKRVLSLVRSFLKSDEQERISLVALREYCVKGGCAGLHPLMDDKLSCESSDPALVSNDRDAPQQQTSFKDLPEVFRQFFKSGPKKCDLFNVLLITDSNESLPRLEFDSLRCVRQIDVLRLDSSNSFVRNIDGGPIGGVGDILVVDHSVGPNRAAIEKKLNVIMKQYLLEVDGESHHVEINVGGDVVIKCDTHPGMIDCRRFSLDEYQVGPFNEIKLAPTAAASSEKAIWKTSCLSIVEESKICISALFGLPVILVPTTCWRMECVEIEQNRQIFQSTRQKLLQERTAMVLENNTYREEGVCGMLAVFARDQVLVLRSLASRELVLPLTVPHYNNDQLTSNTSSSSSSELIKKALDAARVDREFDPQCFDSTFDEKLLSRLHPQTSKQARGQSTQSKSIYSKFKPPVVKK